MTQTEKCRCDNQRVYTWNKNLYTESVIEWELEQVDNMGRVGTRKPQAQAYGINQGEDPKRFTTDTKDETCFLIRYKEMIRDIPFRIGGGGGYRDIISSSC